MPDPLYDKGASGKPSTRQFTPADFTYDPATKTCICPGGQEALFQRQRVYDQRSPALQVQGRQARLPALRATRALFAPPREDRDSPGSVLREESIGAALHRAYETSDRQRAWAPALCAAHRDRRAGLRQSAAQQGTGPLHPANPVQGEHAMEPILPGSQHREAGAQRFVGTRPGKGRRGPSGLAAARQAARMRSAIRSKPETQERQCKTPTAKSDAASAAEMRFLHSLVRRQV